MNRNRNFNRKKKYYSYTNFRQHEKEGKPPGFLFIYYFIIYYDESLKNRVFAAMDYYKAVWWMYRLPINKFLRKHGINLYKSKLFKLAYNELIQDYLRLKYFSGSIENPTLFVVTRLFIYLYNVLTWFLYLLYYLIIKFFEYAYYSIILVPVFFKEYGIIAYVTFGFLFVLPTICFILFKSETLYYLFLAEPEEFEKLPTWKQKEIQKKMNKFKSFFGLKIK